MVDESEQKVSRADLRYQPLCKPLIEGMNLPKTPAEGKIFLSVLEHYSNGSNQTNTAKDEIRDVGGSVL